MVAPLRDPTDHLAKKTFFPTNGENLAQKFGKKEIVSKSVSGYSKTKKKVAWTTNSLGWGGGEGGQNLSGPTTKKTTFVMCVFLNREAATKQNKKFFT